MLERTNVVLRRDSHSDRGFATMEISIVLVVILILAVVGGVVYYFWQGSSKQEQVDKAAAEGASIVATNIAQDKTLPNDHNPLLEQLRDDVVSSVVVTNGNDLAKYCVTANARKDSGAEASSVGPGCA